MRKYLIILVLLMMFFGTSPYRTTFKELAMAKEKKQLYTAYNIWRHRSHNMKCINWKGGPSFIPAGTPVHSAKIKKVPDQNNELKDIIVIKIKGQRLIKISFKSRYHPRKNIKDYFNYMITEKPFEEITAGMTEREISAIKNGILVEGMSKNAVLVSYGYPPEHRTSSLKENTWYYWITKRNRKTICFDGNEKTMKCSKRKNEVLKKEAL